MTLGAIWNILSLVNKTLVWGIALLLLILIAISGFLALQNQKLLNQLAKQSPSPTPQTTQQSPSILESLSPLPSPKTTLKDLQENIEAAINSKNLDALSTYMTNPVMVILQATECCGPQTPDEAVTQMAYIESGISFDFNQTLDLVKNLKSKNPELAGKFIGISKGGEQLIAFGLNDQNRIIDIRMSISYKLFSY